MSKIRVSEIRGSEIRVIEIRVSEIRISSNHRELHGAIFSKQVEFNTFASSDQHEELLKGPVLHSCSHRQKGTNLIVVAVYVFRYFWLDTCSSVNHPLRTTHGQVFGMLTSLSIHQLANCRAHFALRCTGQRSKSGANSRALTTDSNRDKNRTEQQTNE